MKKYGIFVFALLAFTTSSAFSQEQDTTAQNSCHNLAHPANNTRCPMHPMTLTNDAQYSMHLQKETPLSAQDLVHGIQHLMLYIDATGFFYDAEYASPFAKGYTVTGFRLSPTLAYGINQRAQLRIGLNATMFAGLDSLYKVRPTFSLVYMPTRWLQIVAGTLTGSHFHELGDPVYDPSRWIYNYQEDGLQIITNTRHWTSDTWLDWSHYLTPWTADQERFTMGSRHEIEVLHLTDKASVTIPFHFVASHRGGEVKTIDTNTVTTFSERAGIRVQYFFNHSRLTFDMPFYLYHLEDNTLDHKGNGFYPAISYEYSNINNIEAKGICFRATAGFWHGDHFFSAYGNPSFWSANNYSALHMPTGSYNASINSDVRNMLTFNLSLEHEFRGLNLGLQALACHDMGLGKTDFFVSFIMRYKGKFFIF